MPSLVEIRRVEIGPKNMVARVRIAEGCPLTTDEDLEATSRVYHMLPHIVEHACLGDAGKTFRDAMGATELAHLLEHVTVELLAQTNRAGDMPAGRTWVDEVDDRTFEIELACPDDVLVAAALSSGAWIIDWAFSGGADPEPDVDAIVSGLVSLVESVEGAGEDLVLDVRPLRGQPQAGGESGTEEPLEQDTTTAEEGEPSAEGELADEAGLAAATGSVEEDERPLWTPAPEVSGTAVQEVVQEHHDPDAPEVEAAVDEIMATIEMPQLAEDSEQE